MLKKAVTPIKHHASKGKLQKNSYDYDTDDDDDDDDDDADTVESEEEEYDDEKHSVIEDADFVTTQIIVPVSSKRLTLVKQTITNVTDFFSKNHSLSFLDILHAAESANGLVVLTVNGGAHTGIFGRSKTSSRKTSITLNQTEVIGPPPTYKRSHGNNKGGSNFLSSVWPQSVKQLKHVLSDQVNLILHSESVFDFAKKEKWLRVLNAFTEMLDVKLLRTFGPNFDAPSRYHIVARAATIGMVIERLQQSILASDPSLLIENFNSSFDSRVIDLRKNPYECEYEFEALMIMSGFECTNCHQKGQTEEICGCCVKKDSSSTNAAQDAF